MKYNYKSQTFLVPLILILPQLITHGFSLPAPSAMAIFFSITILWFSEIIPLAVSALLVPLMAIFSGILDTKLAFSSFGDPILFLFIGGFLLAGAMEKHGLDKRMAFFLLSKKFTSKSVAHLSLVIALICWILSMWISNTATCAIMTPMVLGIIQTLKTQLKDSKEVEHLSSRLLLITAFASSIGGMATPVGSPPNLIAISLLKNANIHISFFQWMSYGIPISVVMLLALLLMMHYRLPIKDMDMSKVSNSFKAQLHELGKIKRSEFLIMLCFSVAVIGWIAPDIISKISFFDSYSKVIISKLNIGVVALFACMLLFILNDENSKPILRWEDSSYINWGVILLFGGGLCLGKVLDVSSLANILSEYIFFGGAHSPFVLLVIVVLLGILLSEFSSNTASASILVPIVLAQTQLMPASVSAVLAVAVALGASCGFMLPVSTPPNAIIYGTGKIKLKTMIHYGLSFDFIGLITIVLLLLLR